MHLIQQKNILKMTNCSMLVLLIFGNNYGISTEVAANILFKVMLGMHVFGYCFDYSILFISTQFIISLVIKHTDLNSCNIFRPNLDYVK